MKRSISTYFEYALFALLILRPSLDLWTAVNIITRPVSLNPAGIVSLLAIGFWVLWMGVLTPHKRTQLFRCPLVWMATLWMIALFPWAFMPFFILDQGQMAGIREWIRLLSHLPFVYLAASFAMQKRWNLLVWGILLGFVFPAMVGMYQILWDQGLDVRGVQRITGTFVHPNPFACYLVLITGVAYGIWRMNRTHWPRWLFLLLPIGLLVSTFSFTGAGMFAVLVFLCAIGEHAKLRVWALVGIVAFAILFMATPQGRQRLYEVSQVDQLDEIERTGKETSSLTWRLLNWRFLYRQWKERPVLGYGLGTSHLVNPNYNIYEETGHQPHNDYVRFLVETGVIGLFLFLTMLACIGVILWHTWRDADKAVYQRWAWIAIAVYASWHVGSLADNLITATGYQYPLWFGLTGASRLASQNQTMGDAP